MFTLDLDETIVVFKDDQQGYAIRLNEEAFLLLMSGKFLVMEGQDISSIGFRVEGTDRIFVMPQYFIDKLGWKEGDELTYTVADGRFYIQKVSS